MPRFTLRRYDSRNCILPNVPYPTTQTKMNVQTPVMMNPIGKIPKVVPGNTNTAALAAAATAAAAAAVVLPVVES